MKSLLECVMRYVLKSIRLETKKVMVFRNLHQAQLLKVDMTKIPEDHETLFIVHHVGFHVSFSSIQSSLVPYTLPTPASGRGFVALK